MDNLRSTDTVWGNSEATLFDLGDGVLNLEFHSKMNAAANDDTFKTDHFPSTDEAFGSSMNDGELTRLATAPKVGHGLPSATSWCV